MASGDLQPGLRGREFGEPERLHQRAQSLACHLMAVAQLSKVPLVEQRQPCWEQLAIDHTFGQTLRQPEQDAPPKLLQRLLYKPHVTRLALTGPVVPYNTIPLPPGLSH